jgi:HK97 family phage prohead protease
VTTRKLYTGVHAAAPGSIEVVASTGTVDRQRDRVRPGGIRLDNFRRNPIITWAHRYDQLPVGRATELTATERDLRAVIQFAPDAFSQQVYEHYRGRFLNAVSVGFQPLGDPRHNEHGGLDYDAVELLEIACVPVPANQEALVIARSMAGYGPGPAYEHDPYVFEFADDDEPVFEFAPEPEPIRLGYPTLAAPEPIYDIDLGWLAEKVSRATAAAWDGAITRLTGRLPD